MSLPLVILFTKTDKLKAAQRSAAVKQFFSELGRTWSEMPDYFLTSSVSREGRDELLSFIAEVNEQIRSGS